MGPGKWDFQTAHQECCNTVKRLLSQRCWFQQEGENFVVSLNTSSGDLNTHVLGSQEVATAVIFNDVAEILSI